jgi:hypothetical protein
MDKLIRERSRQIVSMKESIDQTNHQLFKMMENRLTWNNLEQFKQYGRQHEGGVGPQTRQFRSAMKVKGLTAEVRLQELGKIEEAVIDLAALKKANVRLTALQLAKGIGGKGWFSLAGVQHDVEAALDGAAASVEPHLLVATELIQRPHADLRGRVV